MEEWKEYKLIDVCSRLKSGKGIKSNLISDKGMYPVIGGNGLRGYTDISNFQGKCGVIGRQGAYCGNVRYFEGESYMTEHAIVIVGNEYADTYYLTYLLSLMHLGNLSAQSAQPGISVQTLSKQVVSLPPIQYQKKVSKILKSLDDKIEANRRINAQLEELAQALFKSWFVDFEPFKDGKFVESELGLIPEGCTIISLSNMANYLNGLAMQKFRPLENERGLPVLKIKELGQDACNETSELCSPSLVDEKYIVEDGDIIFSWSGTLLVKIWCGGICGLNQHLFKVTSKKYPKWYVYLWTKYHLDKFIRIAKDKTVTMGHIKRGELDTSYAIVLNDDKMKELDALMMPIIEQIINNNIEIRKLSNLRDTLLPKLMSGEIEVNEVKI